MRQRNKRRRFREIKKELREWLHFFLCLLTALIIAVFLRIYVYEFVQVKGNSMTPTLINKEFVFVEKINADKPERGEILIVRFPEDENYYIKRLVGVPGDEISVKDGQLFLNGIAQEENYIPEKIAYEMEEIRIPEGMYFVLGDNRNDSWDSHMESVGLIPAEDIVGHAVFVAWPFPRIRSL